jgi:hypothetical protein
MIYKHFPFPLVTCLCISQASEAQFSGERAKQTFSIKGLDDSLATHKTVAILPFKATISYKRLPKNHDPAQQKEEEKTLAENMQQGMYTFLLRKAEKYTVTFQDVERTNAILKKNGVFEKVDELLPDDAARLLGVDAIIRCSYAYEKTNSEGGAIVKAVILGGGGKTGNGSLTMQIYSGVSGTLLWRFFKEMNENVTSNANEVMERMMRKVSRNFPYEK